MRILLTGSGGMVGSELIKLLGNHNVIAPRKWQMNISNYSQVIKYKDLDFIIHLAAETDHEYCDENPPQCYFANTIATGYLTELAERNGCPILYLSAGSIFDGFSLEPYKPYHKPNPINHYNRSKLYGEILCQSYHRHYIVRAGWMFGGGPTIDKKFVNKIITKIKNGDKEIKVCDDCVGSPTYSKDLAEFIASFLYSKYQYSTFHFSNSATGASRYEFAKEIVNALASDVKIVPCSIDDLKDEFPCKRTNYEVIAPTYETRDWRICLGEYIHANY